MRQLGRIVSVVCFLLVFGASTSSCDFLRKTIGLGPRPPKANLIAVSVKKLSVESFDLEFEVKVENPNFFSVDLAKLRYDIHLAEKKIAEGLYSEKISIPAEKAITVKLPLTVDSQNAFKLVGLLWQKKAVTVTWQAVASFDSPFGEVDVEFGDEKPLKI